jgi:hypothetical protein
VTPLVSLHRASVERGQYGFVEEARLKVWSWFGRDPSSLEDLQFVVAVASRKELQQVSVRLSLPSPKQAARVKPSDPVYAEAVSQPNRLLWINLGDLPFGRSYPPFEWSSEEQLADLRRTSTLRHLPGDGIPINRPRRS